MSAREPEPTEATLDSALMARAQTGDESAFEALYERRFGEVSAFLRRRLPVASAEEADDLASQTFYRAYRRRDSFDPGKGTFRNWIYAIAVRQQADFLRAAARRILCWAEPLGLAEAPSGAPDWPLREELEQGLRRLTQRQRDCLLLTQWCGFTYAETGRILGVRAGSVAAHRAKALERMRAWLVEARSPRADVSSARPKEALGR